MYWVIGSFIIIAMMGVLAVADKLPLPIDSLLLESASTPILTFTLLVLTLVLMVISQLHIPSANTINPAKNLSHHATFASRILYFIVTALLAIALVAGSGIKALVSHQQAEVTKITEPMRVQALVHIEGISDSVYDAATDTGYRQVAIISQISPLVSDMTMQDLDKVAADYGLELNNSLSNNDMEYQSLSQNSSNENSLNEHTIQANEYRVLLNAYPKKYAKQPSKSSSEKSTKRKPKKAAKQNQITDLNHLQPGDTLFMTLTIAPLATSGQSLNNPSGFDSYRWLRGRHIDGVANILATSSSVLPANYQVPQARSNDS